MCLTAQKLAWPSSTLSLAAIFQAYLEEPPEIAAQAL